MKLRHIAILFAFAVASAAAHAQGGVYGTFSAQQFTRTGLVSNPPAGSSNSDKPWLYGPTVGAYYTVSRIPKLGELKTGPVAIGFDFRGDFLHGSQYDRSDGLIGLRFTPKRLVKGITPYIQGSAGIGHTKLPKAPFYTNNWSYQFAIGADRKLKGHTDWRVIEASAGFLGSYVAGTAPNNSNYIITLGTGLAFRLGGK
jgi:hypothetical protein